MTIKCLRPTFCESCKRVGAEAELRMSDTFALIIANRATFDIFFIFPMKLRQPIEYK